MPRMTSRTRAAVVVPVVLLIVAAGFRLWNLGSPGIAYWDEQHYIYDANAYLGGGYGLDVGTPPAVRIASEGTWIHPPLGKWLIALLGIGPFGLEPVGWRIPSVLFGVAGVLLLYLLALELWGSVWLAGLAGGLLALDGLHIVQSRLAMLDIFAATFITAGALFLVRHRTRGPTRRAGGRIHRWFGSRDLLLAGVMFGAAAASKWVGLFALVFAIALAVVWTFRGSGPGSERNRGRASEVATIAGSLVVVPALVYLASYGAFFFQHGPAFGDFWTLQVRMFEYHRDHTKVQPQNSAPWTWPLLLHPIQYYGLDSGDRVLRIMALGNPALWWGFLALLPVAALTVLRRACWQDAVAFGGFAALYVPWLFVGRTQFVFYLLPAVPFMCLAVVATIRRLPRPAGRATAAVLCGAVALAAMAYAPLWTGMWIDRGWAGHLRLLPGWDI